MDITLRQARKIEASLKSLEIEHQVATIRAYDTDVACMDIEEALSILSQEIVDKASLNRVRYQIRHSINMKNMECGVSDLLNQRDMLYSEKAVLSTLMQEDNTERQLDLVCKEPSDSRKVSAVRTRHTKMVASNVEVINSLIDTYQGKLNILNRNETIRLTPDQIAHLKEAGLV